MKRIPVVELPNGIRTAFSAMDCANCGVIWAVTADYEQRRREDHREFFCPNGHSQVFKAETATEKAAREAKEHAAYWQDRAKGEERRLEAEKRSHAATKGQLTRTRNRALNGVCPECHRHFANVERHIHNKHPEAKP